MAVYDPSTIEPRWQQLWDEKGTFEVKNPGDEGFDPDKLADQISELRNVVVEKRRILRLLHMQLSQI